MKGDFTRLTFDPAKHYVAVRAQQGRVSVDADVNELQDIADHLRTASLADLVGPAGAPADGGLGVAVGGGGTDVGVTAGRVYVDGVLVEIDEDASLTDQPYLPAGAAVARAADGTWVALADAPEGRYLAYLDAFRHHVTAIDDPGIREVALGGPDTATREQLRWQVRLLRVGDEAAPVGCADEFAAWDAVTAAPPACWPPGPSPTPPSRVPASFRPTPGSGASTTSCTGSRSTTPGRAGSPRGRRPGTTGRWSGGSWASSGTTCSCPARGGTPPTASPRAAGSS